MATLTVLSYNVRSMHDDTAALARVIRAIAPDVVLVQESPRFARWRSKCAALARRSGLVVVSGGRQAGSNLLLSSMAVEVVQTHDLSFTPQRNLHRRGSAVAVLQLAGVRFAVAGLHLDLIEAPRLLHLRELDEAIKSRVDADIPLIVGGDLNAVPGSATWSRLEGFGADAWTAVGEGSGFTYSALQPVRRIDGLFADHALIPIRAEVLESDDVRLASDHRPLVVEYELPKRP